EHEGSIAVKITAAGCAAPETRAFGADGIRRGVNLTIDCGCIAIIRSAAAAVTSRLDRRRGERASLTGRRTIMLLLQ
ncbi:MAG TPA: hypothetical protein VEI25_14925, partial [Paraburkholderia sp.]|nr:hypothetical protein [Paraburkholderia sp.]